MTSNAEIERRWVEAWNDAYEIAGIARNVPCLLPDGSIMTFDECLGWLQASAYEGYLVQVEGGWVGHWRGTIANRSKAC